MLASSFFGRGNNRKAHCKRLHEGDVDAFEMPFVTVQQQKKWSFESAVHKVSGLVAPKKFLQKPKN